MRFVPHRDISFQYSLDGIDSDYDSDYFSDSSLETPDIEEKNAPDIEETPFEEADFQISNVSHILEDLQIQERFYQVAEASSLIGQSRVPKSLREKYHNSSVNLKQTLHDDDNAQSDDRNASINFFYQKLRQLDEKGVLESLEEQFSKQDTDVEMIIKQVEEERKRAEEERKRKEEEERIRLEEEKRRREQEEEERKRKEKLEEEKRLREAEELLKKKAEEEARLATEAELKKLELERQKKLKLEEDRKLKLEQIGMHSDLRIQREFLKYKQDIADIKHNVVEPLQSYKELKQLTNKIRRKVNPKFGQLTDSRQKLLEISREILLLVHEARDVHDLTYLFILNFIAKELIKQAEVEVIVNPQHSIPLGALALNLLQLVPDLKYYLLARFYKKCPYLIGFTCAIDTEEGRERMGWRRSNNKWEEESKYNERVGGIATLYSVISRLTIGDNTLENPIPISKSWIFLSRTLNTDVALLLDVHYIIVANWWDACCQEFLQTYGQQGTKLLHLVSTDWLQAGELKKFSGYVRLRLLAEEWLHGGRIKSFKQMAY